MATYYIDYKNGDNTTGTGATGAPWKTFGKANSSISSGDTVKVRGGTPADERYYEVIDITVTNSTWEADSGHSPIVDGHYDQDLFYYRTVSGKQMLYLPGPNEIDTGHETDFDSCLPGAGSFGDFVTLNATGVTWNGIDIRNVAGEGMTIKKSDCTLLNTTIDFCYSACLMVDGGSLSTIIDNTTITGCNFSRSSMKYYNRNRGKKTDSAGNPIYYYGQPGEGEGGGPEAVTGCFKVLHATDTTVTDCLVAWTRGEGFAGAKGSNRTIFQDCIAYNTYHVSCYATKGCQNVTFRRCVSIQTGHAESVQNDGLNAANFVLGIEMANSGGYTSGPVHNFHNNVAFGGAYCFEVRNNAGSGDEGYDSQLDGSYIGYNTLIGGPHTKFVVGIADNKRGNNHTEKNIFENNLILSKYHTTTTIAKETSQFAKAMIRNNIWSLQPHTTMRSDGDWAGTDTYGTAATLQSFADGLVEDAFGAFTDGSAIGGSYTPTQTDIDHDAIRTGAESIRDAARLVSGATAAIGEASARTVPTNFGMIVPTAVSTDCWGSTRTDASGGYYDIGANEYGGTVTNTLSANFTTSPSPATGTVPLSIAFTDSSSVAGGGASITSWAWTFGDGATSTSASPTHVYATAGVYTARLTVRSNHATPLTSSHSATVTVTPEDQGGSSRLVYDIIRQAAPTSTGNFTFTFGLNGNAPALVLLFMSNATSAGSTADHAMLSWGAVDSSGRQGAGAFYSKDNIADSLAGSHQRTDAALISISETGAVTGQASYVSMAADVLTLNCTDAFPAGTLITAIAWGGADANARVDNQEFDGVGDTVATSATFSLGAILGFGEMTNTVGSAQTGYAHAFGAADAALTTTALVFREANNQAAASREAWYSDDLYRFLRDYNSTDNRGQVKVNAAISSLKVDYATVNNTGTIVSFGDLAGVQVKPFTANSGTGVQTIDLDFTPALCLVVLTSNTNKVSYQSSATTSAGLTYAWVDGSGTYATGAFSKPAATTMNTGSYVENSVILRDGDGTAVLAGTATLGTDKIDINWTTAAAKQCIVVAFEAGTNDPTNDDPVAYFEASPTAVKMGETVVFDASSTNANGAAISAWAWDFGDGETSDEEAPEHAYESAGSYDVSLTVANANGSHTLTRTDYITVRPLFEFFIGPWEAQDITNDSETLMDDDPDSDTFRMHSHRLFALYAEGAQDPGTVTERTGRWRMYWDDTNNKFVIKVNGKTRYIVTTS